jgi:hypothetical protein
MNNDRTVLAEALQSSEAVAAELTAAAYRVALRHGAADKWLDLELDLSKTRSQSPFSWSPSTRRNS